jgi:hypothetical protein
MPSTLYGEHPHSPYEALKQFVIAIAIAAVLGVWAFATTRASSADLVEVEIESKAADLAFKIEIKELSDDIHEFDVKQSAFRAQVREKLQIPNN